MNKEKENNQRYERLKEKPPYYLIVHTNKNTSNFERELIERIVRLYHERFYTFSSAGSKTEPQE